MSKRARLFVVFGMMLSMLAVPAFAALDVGATAPSFTARASLAGEPFTFSLDEALAEGPVVLYFYPAAYTRGCDLEAHTFATHADDFAAADTTIIGVSADSIERLNDFSADPDYCAGKFPVASDPQGEVAARYGLEMMAPREGVTGVRGKTVSHGFLPRVTFVLDADGKVVARFSSQDDGLSPDQHVTRALAIVRKLEH